MASTERLLSELENSRYRFGRAEAARILKLLQRARTARFDDVASLIRFHEALLVLRAFPPSAAVLRASVQLLDTFWKRVERLREKGADMDDFDPLEVSGIAGTVHAGCDRVRPGALAGAAYARQSRHRMGRFRRRARNGRSLAALPTAAQRRRRRRSRDPLAQMAGDSTG